MVDFLLISLLLTLSLAFNIVVAWFNMCFIQKRDNLGERVMSLAFDVISRLLEIAPVSFHLVNQPFYICFHSIPSYKWIIIIWKQGWRLVSPLFIFAGVCNFSSNSNEWKGLIVIALLFLFVIIISIMMVVNWKCICIKILTASK